MKTTCRTCGGPTVPGIDVHQICPECLRLDKFMEEVGGDKPKTDQQRISEGSERRFAKSGT